MGRNLTPEERERVNRFYWSHFAPMENQKLKPRTAAELSKHAYRHEVHRVETAIFNLELISGQSRTIPFVAGMALDDAIIALYKAKGAFDHFQNEE